MNKVREIPEILYKYRDWENPNHKRILYDFEVYLPSPKKFNDPYEASIPFEYAEEELTAEKIFFKLTNMARQRYPDWDDARIHEYAFEAQQKDLVHDKSHKEKLYEKYKKEIEDTYGIFSLTAIQNNFLMWSHYANSHSGFCVGFDSKLLFETVKGGLVPVDYRDDLPKFLFDEDITEFSRKQLATKSTVWEYEDEYRLIKHLAANKKFYLDKSCIKELVFGVKMDVKIKFELIEHVKKNIPHCAVYDTELNQEYFRVDLKQIL